MSTLFGFDDKGVIFVSEKLDVQVIDEKPETTEVKAIAKGKKHKQTALEMFKESFIADEAMNLKEYLIKEVVVPMFQDAIVGGVTNALSMLLYGEKSDFHRRSYGRSRFDDGYSRYNYSRGYSYSDRNKRERDEREEKRYGRPRQYDPVECETMSEAKDIIDEMYNLIETKGDCSIADMYDIASLSSTPEENNYGWRNISDVRIKVTRDGSYIIDLPRAICLK